MLLTTFLFIVSIGSLIVGIVQAGKKKDILGMIASALHLPFILFFFISLWCGGSAFNDAESSYALYQPGHYYLISHGNWTEVTYPQYRFLRIAEIVGISSVCLSFLLSAIRYRKRKAQALKPAQQ